MGLFLGRLLLPTSKELSGAQEIQKAAASVLEMWLPIFMPLQPDDEQPVQHQRKMQMDLGCVHQATREEFCHSTAVIILF